MSNIIQLVRTVGAIALLILSVLLFYNTNACDIDTNTIETAVIFREHELLYEVDTIKCNVWIKSGGTYYLKGIDGNDYRSDKAPVILGKEKKWK